VLTTHLNFLGSGAGDIVVGIEDDRSIEQDEAFTAEPQPGGAQLALPDPVIHLYWAYALARVEEMFKVTRFPPGVCGAQAEREHVTVHPKKITCPFCRERAMPRSGSEQER
jgi:hypothetical protein